MWAVMENNAEAAKLLIGAGADVAPRTNTPPAGGGAAAMARTAALRR
jgi:hypothetical protein